MTLYAAGNAGNGDTTPPLGTHVYLTKAAAFASRGAGSAAITAINPNDSSATSIQPGSWIWIKGTNLAAAAATLWSGNFPTSLAGATVTINNKSGYLYYASPNQINLQAPDDAATGPVNVTVMTSGGSATATVTLAPYSPAWSLLDATHVAGIILRNGNGAYGGGTYDIIGPTGSSLGYGTVAAKAGDIVELYGIGFGPTTPPVPAGQAFSACGAADGGGRAAAYHRGNAGYAVVRGFDFGRPVPIQCDHSGGSPGGRSAAQCGSRRGYDAVRGRDFAAVRQALIVTLAVTWAMLCGPAGAWGQEAPSPAVTGNGYVGSAACKVCHADIWLNFYKNPHFKSVASGKEPPERTGCEGCHGPGAEHVDAHGGKRSIPHAFSLMSPAEVLNDCLGCHARDLSKANIRRSVHTQADVVCTSCHSIHKAQAARVSAGAGAARALLPVPCHRARAVRHAREAPGERRRDGVHGLPQSARNVRLDVADGGQLARMVDQTAGGRGAVPRVP